MQMERELVLVLDFGGQYNQLIARRVREAKVYSEMISYKTPVEKIKDMAPKGIIFSGGPASVNQEGAPFIDPAIYELGVPILGICYGMQLMTVQLGGRVERPQAHEYGKTEITIEYNEGVWHELKGARQCWMSHGDSVLELPAGFIRAAFTANTSVAGIYCPEKTFTASNFIPKSNIPRKDRQCLKTFYTGYAAARATGPWNPLLNPRYRRSGRESEIKRSYAR